MTYFLSYWFIRSLCIVFSKLSVKIQRSDRSRCFMVYHAVLFKFDVIVVTVILQYVLRYIRPLSILLKSESGDLVKPFKRLAIFVLLFQVIYAQIPMQSFMICMRVSVENKNDVWSTKPRRQGQRTFEDHYRVNYFLPFIDHIISYPI